MKKNKLTTAVVASLAGVAGVAGISNAVNINYDGLGEVLIYPYYSVSNDLNTLLTVVNTTDRTKAVKVRFLEGDHSLEVLDFNLYLSPFDVWAAGLVPTVSSFSGHEGEPSGAIVYSDTSCVPYLTSGTEFRPFVIDNDVVNPNKAPNKSMERSTTGHFEIIEMGTLDPTVGYGFDAVHGGGGVPGVPTDCGQLQANWDGGGVWDAPSGGDPTVELFPVEGGLFGAASMINVAAGTSMTYNAIALDNFWAVGSIAHTEPGSTLPSLAESVQQSVVYANGTTYASDWVDNIQAVSALFIKNNVFNEYDLNADVAGKTEWVVTFPTKRFHVTPLPALAPFVETWDGNDACEDYGVLAWDREEDSNFCQVNPNDPLCVGGGVSPIGDDDVNTPVLCQEANVIEFLAAGSASTGTSAILGSTNLATIGSFESGWARLTFAQSVDDASGWTYTGLPLAGFAVQQYTNANAEPGVLAQYAGLFNHKASVNITSTAP